MALLISHSKGNSLFKSNRAKIPFLLQGLLCSAVVHAAPPSHQCCESVWRPAPPPCPRQGVYLEGETWSVSLMLHCALYMFQPGDSIHPACVQTLPLPFLDQNWAELLQKQQWIGQKNMAIWHAVMVPACSYTSSPFYKDWQHPLFSNSWYVW